MKYKITTFFLIAVLIIGFILFFQVKIPLCYQAEEERPITRFVTYEAEKVQEIKADIQKKPYYQIRINGKSMKPAIQHGDVCVCNLQQDYNVDDIVSFYVPTNGEVELIAHRIIIEDEGKFRTKGDFNAFADNRLISKEQIFCKIPEATLFEKFKFALVEYGEFRIR